MIVSFFTNRLLRANAHTDLSDPLHAIRDGRYREIITSCRTAIKNNDQQLYKSLKDQLPAVTFCGTFLNQRKADQISSYNGLLILDIDHIEESKIDDIKRRIIHDRHTLACFLSPSGQGLKFLVPLSSSVDVHKIAFASFSRYYFENHQIVIDRSGSDCSRLCYLSYDPEIYINLSAISFEFDITYIREVKKGEGIKTDRNNIKSKSNFKVTDGYNKVGDRKMMMQIIKFLRKNKLSITEGQEKWYKCAYATANTFTFDIGQKYFIALAELDGDRYDKEKSQKMIEYCYLNRKKEGLKFNTIVFFAQEKGFIVKPKQDANHLFYQLGGHGSA